MIRQLAVKMLRGYQLVGRAFLPSACRFAPSCSDYSIDAIQQQGLFRGAWLTLLRLLRCHPLTQGGWDPVPTQRIAHHG